MGVMPVTEEALFHAALAVLPAARAAYLAEHCPGPDLRRRVADLLAAHDRPAGPLDAPATGAYASAPAPGERPGTMIGPYKLLQRIGEGGMGEVWMAEQEYPVRRRVAVKVIKAGMDSRQVLARFAEALADIDRALALADGSGRTILRLGRALALARAGEAAQALAAADELIGAGPLTAAQRYDLGRVYALAAVGSPPADADAAAVRAVAALRQAVAAGYRDIPHLLGDADLAAVRGRADFAALLWDLADAPP